MALDSNEVLANVIVGLVVAIATWIGTKINKFISKIEKAEKDLSAVFPKLRKLEAAIGFNGDQNVGEHLRTDRLKDAQRGLDHESNRPDVVRAQQANGGD